MIDLKSAIISAEDGPKEPINIVLDKGINHLDHTKEFVFSFFSSRNQSLDEGQLLIDGKCFFPSEDDNDRLIILMIKSKVIDLTACFVIPKSDKEKFKKIQAELTSLKDLPLNNDEQKKNKVKLIFESLQKFSPAYLAVDFNDNVNQLYEKVINSEIKKRANDNVFIVLDKKPDDIEIVPVLSTIEPELDEVEEGDLCHIDLGSGEIKRLKKESLCDVFKNKGMFLHVLRVNKIFYLISCISILFSILFAAIAPHYLVTDDLFMGVFLIASCPLFIYIAYMVALSSYDFVDNETKNTRVRRIITLIYAEIIAVISTLLAVGMFFLLGTNDFLFDLSTYHLIYALGAFIIAFIHIVIPIFAIQFRKFNKIVKKILIREKNGKR